LNNAVKNLASGSSVLNASSSAVTSTGSGPFILNARSSTSATTNQSQCSGFCCWNWSGTATQTMPMQFSSPASAP
jgi:hypothetical protein